MFRYEQLILHTFETIIIIVEMKIIGRYTVFPFVYSGCIRTIMQAASIETHVHCITKCNGSVYL